MPVKARFNPQKRLVRKPTAATISATVMLAILVVPHILVAIPIFVEAPIFVVFRIIVADQGGINPGSARLEY